MGISGGGGIPINPPNTGFVRDSEYLLGQKILRVSQANLILWKEEARSSAFAELLLSAILVIDAVFILASVIFFGDSIEEKPLIFTLGILSGFTAAALPFSLYSNFRRLKIQERIMDQEGLLYELDTITIDPKDTRKAYLLLHRDP